MPPEQHPDRSQHVSPLQLSCVAHRPGRTLLTLVAERLRALMQVLLDRERAAYEYHSACVQLREYCLQQLPSLGNTAADLPSGLALSPSDAAMCVLDFMRTARLVQGLNWAVERCLRRNPESAVHVLYAGCGPLAPLALLLALRFPSERLRFTLIDIHPQALDCARRLFAAAGVEGHLAGMMCADAATLRLPGSLKPDVLLVEVMQRALEKEPQLAVMAGLHAQCHAPPELVPQQIRVSAWLAAMACEQRCDVAPQRRWLAQLLEISADTLPGLAQQLVADPHSLPPLRLIVPDNGPAHAELMLRTEIQTAPGLLLADYDSGLTYPHFQLQLGALRPGQTLELRYGLGTHPGFQVRLLA